MPNLAGTANWIRPAEDEIAQPGQRPVYWLRREFDLSEAQASDALQLEISAQGLYQAFVNGQRVGDQELTPGYTQYRERIQFQTFDVSELLRPGINSIAVLLADGWFRGACDVMRSVNQFGDRTSLIAQISPAGKTASPILTTDSHWRSATSHILGADIFLGQIEDRRLWQADITHQFFDDSNWSAVAVTQVSSQLVEPISPPVRKTASFEPKKIWKNSAGDFVVDFGQNISGWVRLKNLGDEGNQIKLTHGEFVNASGELDTSHLDAFFPFMPEPIRDHQVDSVISAGRPGDVFEPQFTTHGFQYVVVSGFQGELTEADLSAIAVHTDFEQLSVFKSSDQRLSWLDQASEWSFRGNAVDVPTDCPQRERSGWTGDWQIFVDTAAFKFDVDGFSRKFLADVRLDQNADGRVANISPMTEPEGWQSRMAFMHASSGWGDVVVHAPYATYWAYGKTEALAENFEAAKKWIDFGLTTAASGRHAGRTGLPAPHEEFLWDTGYHWGEWLEPGVPIINPFEKSAYDCSDVANAYLYRSICEFVEIAEVLDKPAELIDQYRELSAKVLGAWRTEHLGADGLVKLKTQAAFTRALAFGLIPEEMVSANAQALAEMIRANGARLSTGFLSTAYLLPVLADHGHLELAYELLLQRERPSWLYMRDQGATTVWESWDGIVDGKPSMSLNHYSKGAVANFLYRYVVGLQPTAPGYRSYRVAPKPGSDIADVSMTQKTAYGSLAISWSIADHQFKLRVDATESSAIGEVVLPTGDRFDLIPGTTHEFACAVERFNLH